MQLIVKISGLQNFFGKLGYADFHFCRIGNNGMVPYAPADFLELPGIRRSSYAVYFICHDDNIFSVRLQATQKYARTAFISVSRFNTARLPGKSEVEIINLHS